VSSEFQIEKGLEIPPIDRTGTGRPEKYPWASMGVGDSFFVDGVTRLTVRSAAYAAGKRHGMKFACRTVEGGTRIWRIK